jgi:hypothetical protein
MMKSQVSLVTVKRDMFFETDDDTRDHCLETSPEEKNVSKNMIQSRSRGSLQSSCRKSVEIWSEPQLMQNKSTVSKYRYAV